MKDRRRKSAKSEIEMLVNDILTRTNDPHAQVKLNLIQTIAGRMGWNDVVEKLKNRFRYQQAAPIQSPDDDRSEKWWQK